MCVHAICLEMGRGRREDKESYNIKLLELFYDHVNLDIPIFPGFIFVCIKNGSFCILFCLVLD